MSFHKFKTIVKKIQNHFIFTKMSDNLSSKRDEIRREEKEREQELDSETRKISDPNEAAVDAEFEKEFEESRQTTQNEIDRLRPKIAAEARKQERFNFCYRNEKPPKRTENKENQLENQTKK